MWGKYEDINNQKLMVEELVSYLEETPPLATQILQIAATMSQTLVEYIEKQPCGLSKQDIELLSDIGFPFNSLKSELVY